jgi:hypothetical protein
MGLEMDRTVAASAILILSILAASAQPPAESVTVTGFKSRETLDKFVKSFAAPTSLNGKIARWERGICPLAVGQPPAFTNFVTQRLKDIAVTVGAPINATQSCKPNIEIVFTTTPQALLDNVRAHDADYLGYAQSNAQRDKLATVTRPIEAWYTTETKDLDGMSRIDSGRRLGGGITLPNFTALPCPSCMARNDPPEYLPDATYARTSGNHISDGVRSAFNHIIIVVDLNKLAGHEIGALTDYIAMLALTQLNSLDTCQELPSIVNMWAPGCDQKTNAMADSDLAYLRGLYKMSPDKKLVEQRNEIANLMKEALGP